MTMQIDKNLEEKCWKASLDYGLGLAKLDILA